LFQPLVQLLEALVYLALPDELALLLLRSFGLDHHVLVSPCELGQTDDHEQVDTVGPHGPVPWRQDVYYIGARRRDGALGVSASHVKPVRALQQVRVVLAGLPRPIRPAGILALQPVLIFVAAYVVVAGQRELELERILSVRQVSN